MSYTPTTEDIQNSLLNNEKLTDKQRMFIIEYINNDFNGTQAYLKVTPSVTPESAAVESSRLLRNVNIKQAIKDYLDEVLGQYKDTLEYEIIQTYKLRAFYNANDIVDKDGKLKIKKDLRELGKLNKCIDGIEKTYNKSGNEIIKIKLANRDNALEKLSMYMKLLTQNIDFTSKGKRIGAFNFDAMSEEEAEKLYRQTNAGIKDANKL